MRTKNGLLSCVLCLLLVVFCVSVFAACDLLGEPGPSTPSDCSHDWEEWSTAKKPTCSEKGIKERECFLCGEIESSDIDMLEHDWQDATCTSPKTCKVCAATEGSPLEHTLGEDDGDCTTPVTCTSCGVVMIEAKEEHEGGTATCLQKATCAYCSMEYGDLAEHIPYEDDGDCTTGIMCAICDTVLIESNASHTGGVATCQQRAMCDVCGMEYGDYADHIPYEDDGDCTTAVICMLCDEVLIEGNASHTGGTATCLQEALCEVCGMAYGGYADHIPYEDDGDCTTAVTCTVCDAILVLANDSHIGGNATCLQRAMCDVCGMEYGDYAEHIPNEDDGDCTTALTCFVCDEVLIPANQSHQGGHATCIALAACEICGTEYGELAAHIPGEDDGDCTTEITCTVCGEVTTPANESHVGGSATCTTLAACEICGTEYGEFAAHIPAEDDGDCTTEITCTVCGEVTTPANESHTGGSATCVALAVCEVCGIQYGEYADVHEGEIIWIKHLDFHQSVYSCCYGQISEPQEHTMVDGACTECGFNPTVTVESVEITPNDTQITIAVSISDNPGITGMMLKLQYNMDVLTLTGVQNGEALDVLNFTAPGHLNSGCTFLWDGIEIRDEDIKDGEFLILTFDVAPGALEGEYGILLKINAYDNDLNPFTLIIQGGIITIKNN